MDRFRRLYAYLLDLLSFSSNILYMDMEGDIPFISTMVHPTSFLWSYSTLINLSISIILNLLEILTERVSHSPKNTYFICSSNGFNSSFGAYKIEGGGFIWEIGRLMFSALPFCNLSASNSNTISCIFLLAKNLIPKSLSCPHSNYYKSQHLAHHHDIS